MNLIDLKSYRVRKESSYYNKGYFIADMISMHRCFAALSNTSGELELERNGYIGCVASYKGLGVKTDDTICYDPIVLYRQTYADELMYIAAHEVSHIKNNDGARIRTLWRLLICLSFCMVIIASWIYVPLVIMVPILMKLIWLAVRREVETQADLGALEYVSLNTVLEFIDDYGIDKTRFGWLWYDHATKKKLLRKLGKK
jgi:hypothetical protein